MLFRKIQESIDEYLKNPTQEILLIDGARQTGKSYIIRDSGTKLFENYVELNLLEDSLEERMFADVKSTEDFYLRLGSVAGDRLGKKENTLVFLDEIQVYPELITLLKFLRQDDLYTYISSGSLLGVTLAETSSIPIGSLTVKKMYPLDFEEFLCAMGFSSAAILSVREKIMCGQSLDEALHNRIMEMFRRYLIIGGLPAAVNAYLETRNIVRVRDVHEMIHKLYRADASKYDTERKLKIERIYDMIPSNLENKKKRLVYKDIQDIKGDRAANYQDEFDYLINSGIVLNADAVSNPAFPLIETSAKNLIKLYLNDVGLLTYIYYRNTVRPILEDVRSINLGTVYETVVAQELRAHGFPLFYYDSRKNGEVDFLIDDYIGLNVLPIEVKSGRDYTIHRAVTKFVEQENYGIKEGIVLSNERNIWRDGKLKYMPVYSVMFLSNVPPDPESLYF